MLATYNMNYTATEARIHFGELLRRVVETDEPIFVERGGTPQAVVISPALWARLSAGPDRRTDALAALVALGDRLREVELPDAADIIHQDREDRDARLTDLR